MRSKDDFEKLVYEKAEVLSEREHRYASHRKFVIGTAVSSAAVFSILTAAAFGSLFAFGGFQMRGSPDFNGAARNTSPQNNYAAGEAANGDYFDEDNDYNDEYDYNYIYNDDVQIENSDDYDENDVVSNDSIKDDEKSDSFNNGKTIVRENEENEEEEEEPLSRAEIYNGLPVKIVYYDDHEKYYNDNFEYGLADKTISDKTEIDEFIRRLSSCEQVRDTHQTVSPTVSNFIIVREDTENHVVYEKQYFIWGDFVYVIEITRVTGSEADDEYVRSHNVHRIYSFGMSEDFIELMREYFDKDFMTDNLDVDSDIYYSNS